MRAWLAPVAAALDTVGEPCPVFFRDDDAGWDDPSLFALLALFERHEVPVDVAVIPAAVTPQLEGQLGRIARDMPVRLHQHGYAHANHEPAGRKCEFGASRSGAQLAGDIAAGKRRLHDAFGSLLDPVFTPPWNRCVPATGDVLAAEGITVLSRDHTATPLEHATVVEVPVTVDWMGHHKGVRWTRGELGERLASGIGAGGPVGVMLHHAATDQAEREALGELLGLLVDHPGAANVTIVEAAA